MIERDIECEACLNQGGPGCMCEECQDDVRFDGMCACKHCNANSEENNNE